MGRELVRGYKSTRGVARERVDERMTRERGQGCAHTVDGVEMGRVDHEEERTGVRILL